MSKLDISNLKRQITAKRMSAALVALKRCMEWSYRFETKRWESNNPGSGPTYVLWCAGTRLGSFVYFANGSRPENQVLAAVWEQSGAGQPWLDEEMETA